MSGKTRIRFVPASRERKDELLGLIKEDLGDQLHATLARMELTWRDFEAVYRSRGEVRTVLCGDEAAGGCWIERRGRELHIHALFIFPGCRRRGIGRAVLRALEEEFREAVDVFELGVRKINEGARSLYEKAGFSLEAELEDMGFLIMRKRYEGSPRDRRVIEVESRKGNRVPR